MMDPWDEAAAAAVERLRALVASASSARAEPVDRPDGTVAAAAGAREGLRSGIWPLDWVARAAAFDSAFPDDAGDLLLEALAAVVAPEAAPGLEEADEAALLALQPADWAAAVVHIVEVAPPVPVEAEALAAVAAEEAAAADDALDSDEVMLLEAGFGLVVPVLAALGALDADDRPTPVGAWLLPRGVALGLGTDLDEGDRANGWSGSAGAGEAE
ncbi:hypothetical protein [Egibacter rhizosphaerae]|uniref:hypothetical protein n=1 Tax=Egibacter rhizosphaerae TaxID=1670831 RepID=UPI0013F15BC3|nr:hypothetical protein [Egibacter rhizosphaerae]